MRRRINPRGGAGLIAFCRQVSHAVQQASKVAFLALAVLTGAVLAVGPVQAAQTPRNSTGAIIVRNDTGGRIIDRVRDIERIRASRQPVELRGSFCLSTCTMLIGLENTCVLPSTRFGFHGPSYSGKPMPPDRFEHWSRVMSQTYPKPIRDWYMSKGRYKINSASYITGAELIRLGVKACDS